MKSKYFKNTALLSVAGMILLSCTAPGTNTESSPSPSASASVSSSSNPTSNSNDTASPIPANENTIPLSGVIFDIAPEKSDSNTEFSSGINFTADRFGNTKKAFSFNGVSDKIRLNVSDIKSIAVSLWFKAPYNPNAYPTLVSYGEEHYDVAFFGGTVYGAKTGGIGNYAYSALNNPERVNTRYFIEDDNNFFDSKWHYLYSAYDRDKNKMSLYIDNTLRAQVDINKDLVKSNYIEIGHANSTAPTFTWYKGEMSNIRIYNRGLTTEEVTQLYNEGN